MHIFQKFLHTLTWHDAYLVIPYSFRNLVSDPFAFGCVLLGTRGHGTPDVLIGRLYRPIVYEIGMCRNSGVFFAPP